VPNFVSFVAAIAELAHGEKLRTRSLNHSLAHSAYLMPQEPKLVIQKRKNQEKTRQNRAPIATTEHLHLQLSDFPA